MNEVISLVQDKKRIKSAKYVSNFETIFACPICNSSMRVAQFKSLICPNHHTFDFAKQGYMNLTTQSANTKYSKGLFEARRKLITEGAFYKPLNHAISRIINEHVGKTKELISILDMGCGEGSHLTNICDIVWSNIYGRVVGIGIDISKEGILLASKNYSNKIWAVADLAKTPFKNKQFDVILNILSPSNYAEFNRLLKPNGLVIKVVPKSGYLKELREHFFRQLEKQNYSNSETVERFKQSFQCGESVRLNYTMDLNKSSLEWLVQMSPLTWSITEKRINSFLNKKSAQITVDVDILVGKNTM